MKFYHTVLEPAPRPRGAAKRTADQSSDKAVAPPAKKQKAAPKRRSTAQDTSNTRAKVTVTTRKNTASSSKRNTDNINTLSLKVLSAAQRKKVQAILQDGSESQSVEDSCCGH